jgi:nicotinate-nucleotide adenylyltransferase
VRLGLFGGSFDPPHVGHLLVASDAFEALELDRIVFVPAGVQPLKVGRAVASAEHRLAMVQLLVGHDPRFVVDPIEINRPGLSFTVDTLAAFADRDSEAEMFLLVGADVPRAFARWREPERVMELATVVVLQRGGELETGDDEDPRAIDLMKRLRRLATRRVDISSTEIRQRVRDGLSIRGFVPDAVAEFIAAKRLYC